VSLAAAALVADMVPVSDPAVGGAVIGAALVAVGLVFALLARRGGQPAPRADGEVTPPAAPDAAPAGLAARLRDRMAATRAALAGQLDRLFGPGPVDASVLEPLEEVLLRADVGVPTTERLLGAVRAQLSGGPQDAAAVRDALRAEMRGILEGVARPFSFAPSASPYVLLVVGVNGSGKTTSIGKLAARFVGQGRRVVLAAADTYRAAAADQLAIWAERSGARLVRKDEGADPASVVHEALDVAQQEGADVVIIDTAGRLQTSKPLMEQLGKIRRIIDRKVPGAPHDTLLVLDGTMGQNALSQARHFHEATPLTGAIVTKLDGTARGGMILAVAVEMRLAVPLIGIGERVEDLREFEVGAFVDALT
jgi:fused signal recognition particle receptor